MKRMQLTDEEARVIEQRRLMENKFNLGYNQCISDVLFFLDDPEDTLNASSLINWLNEKRKVIRP